MGKIARIAIPLAIAVIAPEALSALAPTVAGTAGTAGVGALGALEAGSFPTFTGAGLGAGLGGGGTAALSSGLGEFAGLSGLSPVEAMSASIGNVFSPSGAFGSSLGDAALVGGASLPSIIGPGAGLPSVIGPSAATLPTSTGAINAATSYNTLLGGPLGADIASAPTYSSMLDPTDPYSGMGFGSKEAAQQAAKMALGEQVGRPTTALGQLFEPVTNKLGALNAGIGEATGGLVTGKDLAKVAIGMALSQKPQKPQQFQFPSPPGAAIPGPTRPSVKTTGLTRTDQLGAPVSFGQDSGDLQRATNIFTAIASGRGGLNLGDIKDPSSPRALQAARQALFNIGVGQGGNINPGFEFPAIGFQALKKLGKPAQQRTAAGGLAALRELIENKNY